MDITTLIHVADLARTGALSTKDISAAFVFDEVAKRLRRAEHETDAEKLVAVRKKIKAGKRFPYYVHKKDVKVALKMLDAAYMSLSLKS